MFTRKLVSLLTAAITAVCVCGCSLNMNETKKYDDMSVTFLKVGKADAIVIKTVNHTVVIDSANSGEGKDIYQYCAESGSDSLDYFILTHFDQDHVGGAKAVVSKFSQIDHILEANYEESSDEYAKYRQAVEKKGYLPEKVTETVSFTLDDAEFTVYPALEEKYKQVNDYSLAVTVKYGRKAFLFTGDAENKRIKEIISQIPERKEGYDLIKMPHHGKIEKNTDKLIEFANPSYAVICCSRSDPADSEVTELLSSSGVQTSLTYDGTVTYVCNGYEISSSSDSEKTDE